MSIPSTRVCPDCGCEQMASLHGEDKKICTGCGAEIDWPLEEGQASIFKKNVVGGPNNQIDYMSGSSAAWH